MLAIRMQRTGRSGHAMFRVIVQEARLTPTSGNVVAFLGHFDPHAKSVTIDKEKAQFYLDHGAQPSDRMARLLKSEGVKLPSWVKINDNNERSVRNPAKRRSTAPAAPVAEVVEVPEEVAAEVAAAETPAEVVPEVTVSEAAEVVAAEITPEVAPEA
jgi:small subunit ribosomal protein S16